MMLNRMNGWQRLWFCLSALSLLIFGIVYPYVTIIDGVNSQSNWEYRNVTRSEVWSGQCDDYVNKEFSQLQEPRYSSTENTCYHIYNSRRFSATQGPYDEERLAAERLSEARWDALGFVAIASVGVLIASGLVYFLGWMVAWVRRGFAKPAA
ncbi:hypothetical protein [Methylorubrum extorquens]|uniref:DUF3592 domain-containing protein n=1 Tax=Methylorubrum extorquens TaxID=408 RepID=A0AAX3WFF0_METEX|nr:hypothetical protein [Methylorubrum extorquens]WHQ70102.1 hypothetical protein KEC54_28010 [Methylorubrum extorquens]